MGAIRRLVQAIRLWWLRRVGRSSFGPYRTVTTVPLDASPSATRSFQLRTWHFEHAVVVAVLLGVWLATGHEPRELAGSLAVYLSFGHASVSERLREREAARAVPSVECHAKARWYFLGKEVAWAAYFIWSGAWAALVGCAVFAVYPAWRWYWRRVHPMQPATQPALDN